MPKIKDVEAARLESMRWELSDDELATLPGAPAPEPALGDRVVLRLGDAEEVLADMPAWSVHAVASDPDYGIPTGAGRDESTIASGWEMDYNKMGPLAFQQDVTRWAVQAARVAVPGAWFFAFGSMRTCHRLAAGMEDAGWVIRDMAFWFHNQGQMLGVGTKITDDNGELWSTKLRPIMDPIIIARKPLNGTHQANWDAHGTGLLNINAFKAGREKWPNGVFKFSKPRNEVPVIPGEQPHSTPKPLALMRRIVAGITPPVVGATVLDPCMGSGTTIEAALLEGFNAIGIDREEPFVRLAQARVDRVPRSVVG